ncbi:MAG: 50S ribosomal protein L6 [Gemmatimonadota bacterium]
MSRIGRQPISIPEKVEVSIDGRRVTVKGPKGEVSNTLPETVNVAVEDGHIVVARSGEETRDRALHGLARTLVANMVQGVTSGYTRRLEIVGVGYRAEAGGGKVRLSLGFSRPVEYVPPPGVEIVTPTPTVIEVRGPDKQAVGQAAADLRGFRPTEPYKGKGIRYEGEVVRRKAGKTGV